MYDEKDNKFLERAIEISRQGMKSGQGGPFGCVIVLGDEIIGEGCNQVTSSNDPTAHAEVVAIRQACNKLGTYQLTDCDIYTSCEPCPMCLGAIYWARPKRVIYANTREEAAAIEFDDDFIYGEIIAKMEDRKIPFLHLPHPMAKEVFEAWKNWEGKIKY
ncbi:MAG TPA: nucleoside deaminase [Chitinophagaceae bacterium]|nr:nucleoside deaminase [Chitinophagaceae bacterium]HQV86917.1 nucleoside deaminase [Chitinophagaceae bacterium]HQX71430.1 nucleoside deaminase [Chitinophagaceae bacterium]HQZ72980.1 nucleoside deaminase [Chitinophagaceae bacterium]